MADKQKTDPFSYAYAVQLARKHTPDALRKLVALMGCGNPKVELMAATALIDRAWGRPSQNVAVSGTVKHTLEDLITGSYQREAHDRDDSASQRPH